jgi:hypothetical protein
MRDKTRPLEAITKRVHASSIEIAILCIWEEFRLKPTNTNETLKRLSRLESLIKRHGSEPDLKELISVGCDRNAMLWSLGFSSGNPVDDALDGWFNKPSPQTLEALFGLNGRKFSALKSGLLKSADQINAINRRFEFGILLGTPHLRLFSPLPHLLQGYVSLLELAANRLCRGAHLYANMGKAVLTLYVKRRTGRFHDREVAALLAAVHGNNYDESSQRSWRTEQKDLLSRLDKSI